MILVAGTFRLPPGNLSAARPAMTAIVTASRAEAGCIAYAYAEDILDPGLIRVHELWSDRAVLAAHLQSPHLLAWRAAWSALAITDRALALYEVGDPEPT